MIVLDQCKPDVAFAERTESDARRYGDQRFGHEEFRKFERTRRAIWLRNGRPHKHGAAGRLNRPPCPAQSLHQHIAALLVGDANFTALVFTFSPSVDRGDLNGLKNAVVQIALDTRKSDK